MRNPRLLIALLLLMTVPAIGQFSDPFSIDVNLEESEVNVTVTVPENHYLYADQFTVTDAEGNKQDALELPQTTSITDPESGKPKPVYAESFDARFRWAPSEAGAAAINVNYQGCNDAVCFIPQIHELKLVDAPDEPAKKPEAENQDVEDWRAALEEFEIKGSAVGYLKASKFIDFLDQAETGIAPEDPGAFRLFLTDPVAFVRESGLLLAIVFILLGGLLLNLTPCVLPMIPVNLAVIGAGAQAGSKKRGFALGATYGLGIALVYGLLGVLVVLTGSQFGTIQANPWFNLIIAIIFVVLALAMFDIIHIDFSRFQSRFGGGSSNSGSFLLAISMGAVAALLAGACVAPVVIAVLLLATNIYEAHSVAGLMLPFVLGLGMALPWPFAGAGLSFLPKPGKWMVYVKYGFGVGIIFFALYYGHLSYRAFRPALLTDVDGTAAENGHLVIDGSTNAKLAETLLDAKMQGKPVFIDFWANWCKNCKAMDKTTFKDEMVKSRLDDYIFVKYVANELDLPSTKAVMDYFNVEGMPTFVVLQAKE